MKRMSGMMVLIVGMLALFLLSIPLSGTADAALPPRPTLTPTPENRAQIKLMAGEVYEGNWTVVEWQDAKGNWHEVEGWQGLVSEGDVRWGVAEKDFRTGPFRWVVYTEVGGESVASSAPFSLPDSRTNRVEIEVTPQAQ